MDKIDAVVSKLPSYYNKDTSSQVYNLLKAFTDEFDIAYSDYISRADDAIGVGTARGEDLDWRYGSLLNMPRATGESDTEYRHRLEGSTNTLAGGTVNAIRYAVAVYVGIAQDMDKAERCVKIYDGWEYEFADSDMDNYGHIVCVLSLEYEDRELYYEGIKEDIIKCIDKAKAAGVVAHVLVEFTKYKVLKKYTHSQLAELTHDQITKWGVS